MENKPADVVIEDMGTVSTRYSRVDAERRAMLRRLRREALANEAPIDLVPLQAAKDSKEVVWCRLGL